MSKFYITWTMQYFSPNVAESKGLDPQGHIIGLKTGKGVGHGIGGQIQAKMSAMLRNG